MDTLRQRLPRLAALVLLVWLFATGVAFAHTCQTQIDLDCDGCCVEMTAPKAFSSARTDTVLSSAPAVVPVPVPQVVQLAWHFVPATATPPAEPPPRGGTPDIPVVFLRLAL